MDGAWRLLASFKDSQVKGSDICSHCKVKERSDIVCAYGNYICMTCGTISERVLDTSPEWKLPFSDDAYRGKPDTTRCGMPINDLLPLSTGSVMSCSGLRSKDAYILQKFHMWSSMPGKERNLYHIFETITNVAVLHGISKCIIQEAKVLYKMISEQQTSRGDNRLGLIATSIYMSCKLNKVPRSVKEIAQIFNLKQATMTKGCKDFQEIMKMNLNSTTPSDFVNRFCSQMEWDVTQRSLCKELVRRVHTHSLLQRATPQSTAAGCLFLCNMVYGWSATKKKIAQACDVSEVTISKCYKELVISLQCLFDDGNGSCVSVHHPAKSQPHVPDCDIHTIL